MLKWNKNQVGTLDVVIYGTGQTILHVKDKEGAYEQLHTHITFQVSLQFHSMH